MSCFELDGAQTADRGVAPPRVVEGLDVLEDRRGELGAGLRALAIEELELERAEEALGHRVVERVTDGRDLLRTPSREVGALREVLAQQPVGVLVGSALPGTLRVREVDGDTCLDRKGHVLGQLLAPVPRE